MRMRPICFAACLSVHKIRICTNSKTQKTICLAVREEHLCNSVHFAQLCFSRPPESVLFLFEICLEIELAQNSNNQIRALRSRCSRRRTSKTKPSEICISARDSPGGRADPSRPVRLGSARIGSIASYTCQPMSGDLRRAVSGAELANGRRSLTFSSFPHHHHCRRRHHLSPAGRPHQRWRRDLWLLPLR